MFDNNTAETRLGYTEVMHCNDETHLIVLFVPWKVNRVD